MNTERNKEIIRRWIEEGWNRGDVEVADELYSSDFTAAPMVEGESDLRGIEAVKQYVNHTRAGFPDLHFRRNSHFGRLRRGGEKVTLFYHGQ